MKQSCSAFLSLVHPVDTLRWALPLTAAQTGGRGSLFGGVGLAAGIVALEQATGKPVIWATGQYLALTRGEVTIDLEVSLPAVGRNVTQGRVVGHVGEQEIITLLGAAGARPSDAEGCWIQCPQAPPPEDCPEIVRSQEGATVHDEVELRLARGSFGFTGFGTPTEDGRSLLWARMPRIEHDAGALAIIADYMPSALGNALGTIAHSTSLDNTIRFGQMQPTEWVLCDNSVEYLGNGFGHGTVHLWSDSGVLLATASQSMIVRVPDGPISVS